MAIRNICGEDSSGAAVFGARGLAKGNISFTASRNRLVSQR
jgi:hypothetical protein